MIEDQNVDGEYFFLQDCRKIDPGYISLKDSFSLLHWTSDKITAEMNRPMEDFLYYRYTYNIEEGTMIVSDGSDAKSSLTLLQGFKSSCGICKMGFHPEKSTAQRWCLKCEKWSHERCIKVMRTESLTDHETWRLKCIQTNYKGDDSTIRMCAMNPIIRSRDTSPQGNALEGVQVMKTMKQLGRGKKIKSDRLEWLERKERKLADNTSKPFYACPTCSFPL